jgi:tyrosyl-DNA phosphodiesterase 2
MEFDLDSGELGGIEAPDYSHIQTPGLSHSISTLDSYFFCDENHRWLKYQKANQTVKGLTELSLLTWNMWFGKTHLDVTIKTVIGIIEELNPDVVGLLQTTPQILQILEKAPFIRQTYYLSDVDGSTLKPYGVVLLAKFPFGMINHRPLVSKSGREMLIAYLKVNKTDLWINAACLESHKSAPESRLEQARSLNGKITAQENSFLLLSANNWGEEERKLISSQFTKHTDSWHALHPEENGYTIDTSVNTMINREIQLKGGIPLRRRDRSDFVYYSGKGWKLNSIKVVGNQSIPSMPLRSFSNTIIDTHTTELSTDVTTTN